MSTNRKIPSKAGAFLKNVDIFGFPISLATNNKSVHTTKLGGIFTIMIMVIFILITVLSFYNLITLKSLATSNYSLNLGGSYGSMFTSDYEEGFVIAIKSNVEAMNNWTVPFFNITMKQTSQNRIGDSTIVKNSNQISLVPCTPDLFKGQEDQYRLLGLDTALCAKNDSNFTIEGSFTEKFFTYMKISLTPCSNTSVCQPEETIRATIDNNPKLAIDLYILNNDVDEGDFFHPISSHISSDLHFLVNPFQPYYKTTDIFLSEAVIETDYSYFPTLFSQTRTIKTFSFKGETNAQSMYAPSKDSYADFYIRKSQTAYYYKRSVGQILQVISYIGGFWSTCFVCFSMLFKIYARHDFINKLANKLYDFPSLGRRKAGFQTMFTANDPSRPMSNRQKILQKIEDHLSYERNLKAGFKNIFIFMMSPLLCCLKRNYKLKLMAKSEQYILRDLDIYSILRKLHEVDAMREVLFNIEQQNLLKFSPKQSIDIHNPLKMDETLRRQLHHHRQTNFLGGNMDFDNIGVFEKLITSWNVLRQSEEKSGINERLLKLFDEGLRKLLSMTNPSPQSQIDLNHQESTSYLKDLDEHKEKIQIEMGVVHCVNNATFQNFTEHPLKKDFE